MATCFPREKYSGCGYRQSQKLANVNPECESRGSTPAVTPPVNRSRFVVKEACRSANKYLEPQDRSRHACCCSLLSKPSPSVVSLPNNNDEPRSMDPHSPQLCPGELLYRGSNSLLPSRPAHPCLLCHRRGHYRGHP